MKHARLTRFGTPAGRRNRAARPHVRASVADREWQRTGEARLLDGAGLPIEAHDPFRRADVDRVSGSHDLIDVAADDGLPRACPPGRSVDRCDPPPLDPGDGLERAGQVERSARQCERDHLAIDRRPPSPVDVPVAVEVREV
jgi:hypothetical protein